MCVLVCFASVDSNMMLELKRYRSVTHVVVGVTSCVVMLLDHQNQTLRDLLSQGMPSNPNSLRVLWVRMPYWLAIQFRSALINSICVTVSRNKLIGVI